MTGGFERARALAAATIETCGKCGDCASDGTQATSAKRHVDRPCAVKNVLGFEAYDARGRLLVLKQVLQGSIPVSDALLGWAYTCTTCGACKETCLAIDGGIDTPSIVEAFRADLAGQGNCLPKHRDMVASIEAHGNPYGEPRDKRRAILEGRTLVPGAGVLLFLGCTASYRETALATATLDLLDALGIGYNVLDDEGCCGSVLKRLGHETAFARVAGENARKLAASGASTVVFPCAGCYRSFVKDHAPYMNGSVRLLHLVEFLDERLAATPREFKFKNHVRITYHDPCHLGRHAGVYEAPRNLLKRIGNATFIELDASRNHAHCCGSGGGVKSSHPDLARRIAGNRNLDAAGKQAGLLVSACPFCERNLRDGLDGLHATLAITDIAEVLASTLQRDLGARVDATAADAGTGGKYMAYLGQHPDIFVDLVEGSVMDFTIYDTIEYMESDRDPTWAFHVTRTGEGILVERGRADTPDLQLALSTRAVERLIATGSKTEYASLFGSFYNDPDEERGWIDFVLHKRTKSLISMGYGKFAEAAGILEDEDAI